MLFNSGIFLLVFLPVVYVLFMGLRLADRRWAISLLVLTSFFFYSWTEPTWVFILIGSIVFNFFISRQISQSRSKYLTGLGVTVNLAVLGYYKYTTFILQNISFATGYELGFAEITLPIGISFFTFQQIAFLVDCYKGKVPKYEFGPYCLFVSFFPQLIAGPIVHHREIMPQLVGKKGLRPTFVDFQVGFAIFVLGLFKKLLLADNVEIFATPVFAAANDGYSPTFLEAWGGALAYTFQIYFDFSGYSDMAIGLARLFGIRLPANFNSPYKATNIHVFWRRWHMTLSRFLRVYLYFPLGGNRKGNIRRHVNVITVMLLGGFWHGAGWGFVIWGGLHGVYLMIFQAWSTLLGDNHNRGVLKAWIGRILTFLAVVIAWVFFRAESVDAAGTIIAGMLGLNGFVLDKATALEFGAVTSFLLDAGWIIIDGREFLFIGIAELTWLATLLLIVWFAPNTQEIFADFSPVIDSTMEQSSKKWWGRIKWRPDFNWAVVTATFLVLSLPHIFAKRPFLYFQF